ncbi:oligosaccharide flippase family protein [Caldifermentibacillus hisashii]|uniref:lipopolysaccharide biosynthesis protein n=1 Tax=Caldifermentibacillus hisashii TaxID=996558 RepID=UPI0030D6CB17
MLNKQTAINLIAQMISSFVNLGIGFLLTPFIVNNIGVESYGFVGLANNFISYAQILTVALNSMAGRFITISLYQNNSEDTNKYFTSVFYANVVMSVGLTVPLVFILIFLDHFLDIPEMIVIDVTILFGIFFANFLINIISSVFGISTFAKNRLDLASWRNISSDLVRVITLVTTFSLFIPKLSYIGVATLLSTLVAVTLNIIFTKKLLPNIKINRRYFELMKIKEILSSGIWNSITQLSQVLSKGLNLLISNIYIGATSMGVLSVAQTVPQVILSLFAVLSNVFAPQLTISYAKQDKEGMQNQLLSSIKILGIFSSIPMAILFAYGEDFYSLWVPNQDAGLLQILSIIICAGFTFALPLEGIWNIFTAVNKVKQTSLFLLSNSVLNIIVVLLVLPFVHDSMTKLLIIVGVEAAISIIRSLTFLPIYGAQCINIKLTAFYPAIFKHALSLIIVTLLSVLVRNYLTIDSWFTLILAAFATVIIAVIINVITVLDKNDRENIVALVKKRGR